MRNFLRNLLPVGAVLATGLLAMSSSAADLASNHPGILSLRGVPSAPEDWAFAPFSDQGAWFAFSVPSDDRPEMRGGFAGPFLMPEGRWISPQLVALELRDMGREEILSLNQAAFHRADAYPGSLRREWSLDGLEVRQHLWFDSAQTALLVTLLKNTGNTERELDLALTGSVFPGFEMETAGSSILARSPSGATVRVEVDRDAGTVVFEDDGYRWPLAETVKLAAADSVLVALAMTFTLPGDSGASAADALADPLASRARNEDRWNRYLAAVDTGEPPTDPVQVLAVKSLMTLVNNWRAPAGRMRYSALFPSSNVWYFNGFWAWDSWKHAVGILRFAPELAKDQVRAMFAHQDERGMIADVVYQDAGEDNWRNTKPPLAGWAVGEIYEKTGDLEFVRELYPRLAAYHHFWYADRDHDQDGLCEFGSTDGTIIAARWESGMDNAVRFDQTTMRENGPGAWSMNQESVDLNAYLYFEKMEMAILAAALDREVEATRWKAEGAALKTRIQEKMYDEESGWFYDIDIHSGSFVRVQGPEGWIPLWTGVANAEQAARVRETMLDPEKFKTQLPFPTVAADHPEFSDGYWRGSVWLDQVYFAIDGLRRYGFEREAASLTSRVFANLEGAVIPGVPLRENYHPRTGAGQNVRHFSWTAAHLLMMVFPPGP